MARTDSHTTVPLSIRIPEEVMDQLTELATATERTKSFLAAEAIESYLVTQAWQTKAIKEAVYKANSTTAKFHRHEAISNWLGSWGSSAEQGLPK